MNDVSAQQTPLLRPANVVMELPRLGSMHASRLSFARSLVRQMARQRWRITCEELTLDDLGYGLAIYRIQTPNARYHGVIFAQPLDPSERSDRVIANAWDVTFGLVEGDAEETLMEQLRANIPLQEAGRQHPRVLVLSRANRSVRNFEAFSAALAAGEQPSIELMKTAGYLYRTTAVYGNGKFGIADYGRLKASKDFRRPFSAQMTAVYILRDFAVAQVEHIAQCRNPERAVTLHPDIKRYLGTGNSTGLGMAPFLVNHPQLINQWVYSRESALAQAKAQSPTPLEQQKLLALLQRARAHFAEMLVADPVQQQSNLQLIEDIEGVIIWLEQVPLDADLWIQLTDWSEAALSLESQELINSLILELYPTLVDVLDDDMSAEEGFELTPDMPLVRLKQLIETHFDWALATDFSAPEATYWFWYRSTEKEEPRLGVRGRELGEEKEIGVAIAPRVARVHGVIDAFLADNPRALTIEFLMAHPKHMDIIRRIQVMADTTYGEIRANLWHKDMRPIHLLRAKLAFFGANRFDPRSDRWVRITLFQGAPLIEELNQEPTDLAAFDDWSFPLAPQQV